MAYEPPADLVAIQRRFFDLDDACKELDGEELETARAQRLQVVNELYDHGWWAEVENRHEASKAAQDAARR